METTTAMDLQQTLSSIDAKLDRLSAAVHALSNQASRVDERMIGHDARLKRHELRLDQMEDAQRDIEQQVAVHTGRGAMMERAAWILFAAALTLGQKFIAAG
jgi:chromosome segregation ATPase